MRAPSAPAAPTPPRRSRRRRFRRLPARAAARLELRGLGVLGAAARARELDLGRRQPGVAAGEPQQLLHAARAAEAGAAGERAERERDAEHHAEQHAARAAAAAVEAARRTSTS